MAHPEMLQTMNQKKSKKKNRKRHLNLTVNQHAKRGLAFRTRTKDAIIHRRRALNHVSLFSHEKSQTRDGRTDLIHEFSNGIQ